VTKIQLREKVVNLTSVIKNTIWEGERRDLSKASPYSKLIWGEEEKGNSKSCSGKTRTERYYAAGRDRSLPKKNTF